MTGTSDNSMSRARLAGLIERDDQWAALETLLTDSLSGSGRVALLTGPVASGKTELLHAFGEACGVNFVKATCSAFERDLPFGVVGQIFHPLDAPAEVGELLDAAARSADGPSARQLHALCIALMDLTAETPLVIGCQMGGRSAKACEILSNAGYTDVANVLGGWGGAPQMGHQGWTQAGLPVETSASADRQYESLQKKSPGRR